MALLDYVKSIPSALTNPLGVATSLFKPKPVAPTDQLSALRAANAPARNAQQQAYQAKTPSNPTFTEVGAPPSPKTPPLPAQQGAVSGMTDMGFQTKLAPTDPAAIGGSLMKPFGGSSQTSEAPETLKAPDRNSFTDDASYQAALSRFNKTGSWATLPTQFSPTAGASQDPFKAAQDAYLKSLLPSADVTSTQQALSGVATTAAEQAAKAQQEYADRVKAIQEQATLQPFLTGRQTQAQGQLTNQLGAIQAASQAQTLPLQERLAQFQAQQQAQQEAAKAQLGFATPATPVEVGGSLVNPKTGKVIYSSPAAANRPISVSPGETLVDPATGKPIYSSPAAPKEDRVLSATEAQALGVPFGTTAGQAYGISPTKPLTEAQAKDVTFASRAGEANGYIDELQSSVASMNPLSFAAQVAAEPNSVGNAFVSDDIRRLRQAERNFETAVLRRESGAAISASEFATDEKKYFPRPGDDAKTLQQKAQARATAIKSMMPANAPSSSAPADGDFSW